MSQHQKKICKRSKNELQSDQFINAARVRVHPTSDQKECLKRYFGISRVIWNEDLDLIYKHNHKKNWHALRDLLLGRIPNNRDIEADRETRGWRYDNSLCPVSIKEETVHQMVSSIKATEQSLLAQGKRLQYEMCYKRKKDRIQSI
ncbi:hypothetical protein MP638_000958, partial [Amoeboaphelidium occidentale]